VQTNGNRADNDALALLAIPCPFRWRQQWQPCNNGRDYQASEAAPCPLQPCYFAKWDILADISDYQYVMGFPACIFDHFLPIFRIPCHRLMYERDCPIFQKLFFPKIRITVQLLFCLSISKLVYYYRIIMLLFMGFLF
jgi:hypothetical protein